MKPDKIYIIWKSARQRGEFCEEWNDFAVFRDWVYQSGYKSGLRLLRNDTKGKFEPANCKWGSIVEMSNNHSGNRWLDAFGEKKTLSQWSQDKRCVVSYTGLQSRIKEGWNAEDAILTPLRTKGKLPISSWTDEEISILKNNSNKSLRELAELLPGRTIGGIQPKRLKIGLPKKNEFVNWSKEEIAILFEHGPHLSVFELAPMLPRHSTEGISGRLKRLKIRKTYEFKSAQMIKTLSSPNYRKPEFNYKLDQTFRISDLDNTTYQVLIGSLLGDGGITKHSTGKCYLFKEDHGLEQRDYLLWKKDMLKTFMPTTWYLDFKPSMGTPVHPIFKLLREEFYNEEECRKAFIPMHYIERLDELGLLIWYLDDGWRDGGPYIGSTLFSEEDLRKTVDILDRNLNLHMHLKVGKKCKFICFPAIYDILPSWQDLFEKYNLPECMRYKIKLRPRKIIPRAEIPFVNPNGEICICKTSISAFAKQHGLHQKLLVKVINGQTHQHKGWTIKK